MSEKKEKSNEEDEKSEESEEDISPLRSKSRSKTKKLGKWSEEEHKQLLKCIVRLTHKL